MTPASPTALAFSTAKLDRASHMRSDRQWQQRALDNARVLPLCDGKPLVRDQHAVWIHSTDNRLKYSNRTLFLGIDSAHKPVFAADILQPGKWSTCGIFTPLRDAMMNLSNFDSHAAGTARSIFAWHRDNKYCARCGQPTKSLHAGWRRKCSSCSKIHFPRVDPVAIMLAVHGETCLLGRRHNQNFHSCLAGFIEPGESVEDGARRELLEESGIIGSNITQYLYSQPWPFESCLMTGLIIQTKGGNITLTDAELAEANWHSRNEATLLVRGKHPSLRIPPPPAIAHQLIRHWALQQTN